MSLFCVDFTFTFHKQKLADYEEES